MRKHSKTIIATGAASLLLLGLTACGPTAVEEDPGDVTPGVEQPTTPEQPAPEPAPSDDTTLPGDDGVDDTGDTGETGDTDGLDDTGDDADDAETPAS